MEKYIKESEILNHVFTAEAAAVKWGITRQRVNAACKGYHDRGRNSPPRFTATEARQHGRNWLVTDFAMARVFGERKEDKNV